MNNSKIASRDLIVNMAGYEIMSEQFSVKTL